MFPHFLGTLPFSRSEFGWGFPAAEKPVTHVSHLDFFRSTRFEVSREDKQDKEQESSFQGVLSENGKVDNVGALGDERERYTYLHTQRHKQIKTVRVKNRERMKSRALRGFLANTHIYGGKTHIDDGGIIRTAPSACL